MKQTYKLVFLSSLLVISTCKSSRKSKTMTDGLGEETVGTSGSRKTFYSGYHSPSKQFLYHICMVPTFALVKQEDGSEAIDQRFLVPDLYVNAVDSDKGETLVERKSMNETLKEIGIADFVKNDGDAEGTIEFIKDASAGDLMSKVAGGLDVNMKVAGGKVSGGAEVALSSASTNRSATLTYIARLKSNSLIADPASGSNPWALTAYGKQIQAELSNIPLSDSQKRIDFITSKCGTHYLSRVQFGATFIANLKIATRRESDKEVVSGKLNAKIAAGKGSADLCINKGELASDVKVNLSIYQFGGNPVSLGSVLSNPVEKRGDFFGAETTSGTPNSSTNSARDSGKCGAAANLVKDASGSDANNSASTQPAYKSLINCSIENINDCMRSFEAVMYYATTPKSRTEISKKMQDGEKEAEVLGAPSDNFGGTFLAALNNESKRGFGVTGYQVRPYSLSDFAIAGLYAREDLKAPPPPSNSSKDDKDSGLSASTGKKDIKTAESNAKVEETISVSAEILKDQLFSDLERIVDNWAHLREVSTLIESSSLRNQMKDLVDQLGARMTKIRLIFASCRLNPGKCEESLLTYNEEKKIDIPISKVVADADKILRDSLKDATFETYCRATGLSQFRLNTPTGWKLTMKALTENAGTKVSGIDDPVTFKSDIALACDANSPGFDANKCATEQKNLNENVATFCKTLGNDLSRLTQIDLKDKPDTEGKYSAEPIENLSNVKVVKFSAGSGGQTIANALSQLSEIERLEIRNASLVDFDFIRNLPHLKILKIDDFNGYLPSSNSENKLKTKKSYFADAGSTLVRQAYVAPTLMNIELNDNGSSSGGTLRTYDINLSEVPRLSKEGALGNKTIGRFYLNPAENAAIRLKGVPEFFGFKENSKANTCSESYTAKEVLKWFPTDEFAININKAVNLRSSPCCDKVKTRCAGLKKYIGAGAEYMMCDISCGSQELDSI